MSGPGAARPPVEGLETQAGSHPGRGGAAAQANELLELGRLALADAARVLAEPSDEDDVDGGPDEVVEESHWRSYYAHPAGPAALEPRRTRWARPARLGFSLSAGLSGLLFLGLGIEAVTSVGNASAAGIDSAGGTQPYTSNAIAPVTVKPWTPPPAASRAAAALPVPTFLSLPSLGTRGDVVAQVGVIAGGPETGLLDAPGDARQLGWYRHGSHGVLVIDGHVGFRSNPGPLAYIGSMKQGAIVVVGFGPTQKTYRLVDIGDATKGQLPDAYFSSRFDGSVMLITCNYNSPFKAGHFADNVFVVATPT